MRGQRGRLVLRVLIWLAVRLAIGAIIAAVVGFAAAAIVPRIGADLRLAAAPCLRCWFSGA